MARTPYPLFIALRYLRFHRGRTFLSVISLISVGGVCVGTAALVIALSLNAGFGSMARTLTLEGAETGLERGTLTDRQLLGRLGVGFTL